MEKEHAETPGDVVESTDSQAPTATEAEPDLSGAENDLESINPISENKGTDVVGIEEEKKTEDPPEEAGNIDESSEDTTALQDSKGSQSAGDIHSLHVQDVENVDHRVNGHIALENGRRDLKNTELARDQPEVDQGENEPPAGQSNHLPAEHVDPEIDPFPQTQQDEREIEWGQTADVETADIFGPNGGQEVWGNGEFLSEINDATEERPDPESQGYTLLEDRDDQYEDRQDPEMGNNTSADVHDAEPDEVEDLVDPFAEASQQQDELDDGRVAAFSQVQGNASESSNALEFVAHQLVDPSNPVPQDMSEESTDDVNENTDSQQANNWWENTGSNEVFDFNALETEGGFDDDFDPTNGMKEDMLKEDLPSQDDPFAEILNSDNTALSLDLFNSKGTLTTAHAHVS